jgi:hypothetical protein
VRLNPARVWVVSFLENRKGCSTFAHVTNTCKWGAIKDCEKCTENAFDGVLQLWLKNVELFAKTWGSMLCIGNIFFYPKFSQYCPYGPFDNLETVMPSFCYKKSYAF